MAAEPDVYEGHGGARRYFAGFEGLLEDVRFDLGRRRQDRAHGGASRAGRGAPGASVAAMTRLGALVLAAALLLFVAAPAGAANRWIQKRAPLNIAHQGGEDEFPSNTLYAFRKAVRAGADMLELDIGVTKDGKVIVMHDTTVDGKTNGHGTVASKTLKQIERLDAAYWFAPAKEDHYGHDHRASA
jgi:glycerophosphoryl diester phosphodiesterase